MNVVALVISLKKLKLLLLYNNETEQISSITVAITMRLIVEKDPIRLICFEDCSFTLMIKFSKISL